MTDHRPFYKYTMPEQLCIVQTRGEGNAEHRYAYLDWLMRKAEDLRETCDHAGQHAYACTLDAVLLELEAMLSATGPGEE